jgi:hypothetical protein
MPAALNAFTAQEIATEAGVPLWRVQYVARTRNIEATERVGNMRLFGESDKQFILSELRRIDREGGERD